MTKKDTGDQVNLNDYEITEKLGEGGFGSVYIFVHKRTSEKFAGKISKYEMTDEDTQGWTNTLREISLMRKISHPAVIKFIGYSKNDFEGLPKPVIITEYFRNRSLDHILHLESCSRAPPDWTLTKRHICLYGIASALDFLHSNNIIHRDVKAQNILLDEYLYPILADFGLAKIQNGTFTQDVQGTPDHLAPEILTNPNLTSTKVDVYSYGIMMYCILTLRRPYPALRPYQILYQVPNNNLRPDIKHPDCQQILPDYLNLMQDCWDADPNKRPSFKEILERLLEAPFREQSNFEEDEFDDYVEFITESQRCFDENKTILTISDFLQKKESTTIRKTTLHSVKISLMSVNKDDTRRNFSFFEKEANNNPFAKINLAECYEKGEGVEQDQKKAFTLYKEANNEGNLLGLLHCALCYLNGIGVTKDEMKAANLLMNFNLNHMRRKYASYDQVKKKLFEDVEKEGLIEIDYRLGKLFLHGIPKSKDWSIPERLYKAFEKFDQVIKRNKNKIDAIYQLGKLYESGIYKKLSPDKEEAYNKYVSIHEKYPKAACRLGRLIQYNEGVPSNSTPDQAKNMFKKALSKGYHKANLFLGDFYLHTKNKPTQAEHYYQEGIDHKVRKSYIKLGLLYEKQAQFDLAKQYYEKFDLSNTATIGYQPSHNELAEGLFHLARWYDRESNTKKELLDNAINYYKQSSEYDYIPAKVNLGYIYDIGRGVPSNRQQAKKLYKEASKAGNMRATVNLARLLEKKHPTKAIKIYQEAAADGYQLGAFYYGCYLMSINQNKEAKVQFKKASSIPAADVRLGMIYETERQYQAAFNKYYHWSLTTDTVPSNKSLILATYRLGLCYERKIGTERNEKEAYNCYKAIYKQYKPAQIRYALILEKGCKGITAQPNSAFELYKELSPNTTNLKDDSKISLNEAEALFHVARCYAHKIGCSGTIEVDEIRKYLKIALSNGCEEARYELAIIEYNHDKENANKYCLQAALRDNYDACYTYAIHNMKAEGRNLETLNNSYNLLKEASKHNHHGAEFLLSHFYWNGIFVQKNREEAEKLLQRSNFKRAEVSNSNPHSKEASLFLGWYYDTYQNNRDKAIKHYEYVAPDAEEATMNLGLCYLNDSDETKRNNGLKIIQNSAGRKEALGALNLGIYYLFHAESKGRLSAAFKNFQKASEYDENLHEPWFYLGYCFEKGYGCKIDANQAVEYYTKSFELGNTEAAVNLALLYYRGQPYKDINETIKYLLEAAKKMNPRALYNLGQLYETGIYEEAYTFHQNLNTAFTLYLYAAKAENSKAKKSLKRLYKQEIGNANDRKEAELIVNAIPDEAV